MLKRYAALLLSAAALVLLSACGGGDPAAFSAADCSLNIGGNEYHCGEPIEPVLAAFGDGYSYSEGLNCAYDSVDKTFVYPAATFYTVPLEAGDIISEIYTEDPAVTTSRDIAVGATKNEAAAAHGEGYEDLGNLLIYRVAGEGEAPGRGALCFEMEGDQVIAIFVTTEAV